MDNGRRYTTLTQDQFDAISDEDLATLVGNQHRTNSSWNGDGQAPYLLKWEGNKPTFLWGAKSGPDYTHTEIKAAMADPEHELYREPVDLQ
tara:strand:+ start:6779 stop:7051 length:273 start_codon:yes stop_codon:yes gene_type:complete